MATATPAIAVADEYTYVPPETTRFQRLMRTARNNPLGVIGLIIAATFVILGAIGPYVVPNDPTEVDASAQFVRPSAEHPFGTNHLGQDMLSRVIAGARLSLLIGGAAVFIGVVGGSLIGVASGYFGGFIDSFIQRTGEAGAAFPGLILYLTLIAAIGRGVDTIIIAIAIGAIIGGSRVLRSITLVLRHSQFVEAAKAAGATETRIFFTHMVPNVVPIIIVIASGAWGAAILAEATLSFLGIGVEPGTPSWGNELSGQNLQNARVDGKWYLVIVPGVCLSLVVLGFNLLGDTLRDILDPRLRGSIR